MANPILRCDRTAYEALVEDRKSGRVDGTTVVTDAVGLALYFSKEMLPYTAPTKLPDQVPIFHHLGVCVHRPNALWA